MSDDKLIGHGVCPVCSNTKARFTVSKKSLACMTCNACNSQIFARSDSSDEKLRSFIRPAAAPAAAPVVEPPAPKAEPAPAATTPTEKPKPKPAAPGWGFLGAFNG